MTAEEAMALTLKARERARAKTDDWYLNDLILYARETIPERANKGSTYCFIAYNLSLVEDRQKIKENFKKEFEKEGYKLKFAPSDREFLGVEISWG